MHKGRHLHLYPQLTFGVSASAAQDSCRKVAIAAAAASKIVAAFTSTVCGAPSSVLMVTRQDRTADIARE
jgi:hypothetical protein